MKRALGVACLALALCACGEHRDAAPLSHRAYIWQRDWNAPVADAIAKQKDALTGFIVLGAEITWKDNAPEVIKPRVDWNALRDCGRSASLALRAGPGNILIADDAEKVRMIITTAKELIDAARSSGVSLKELQLDFDCAQKKLANYRRWMTKLRDAIKPLPLVITTLPAWLDENEFALLARDAGRFVLQVHSVRVPKDEKTLPVCDPALARGWVKRAAKLGVPFEIALPTYRFQAGYDADGKFIGIESDSVRPKWPPGTRVKEFATDASAMAALVSEWSAHHPANCEGVIWYRLPIGSDRNNWPAATLRAVIAGRAPKPEVAVLVNKERVGDSPLQLADLSLLNTGETDDLPRVEIEIIWAGSSRAVTEALPGWSVRTESGRARFVPENQVNTRLPPGASRAIGWLRLEPAATIHVEIIR